MLLGWEGAAVFPVLAAWIADHAENETLHGLKRMTCMVCAVPVERLGWDAKEVHPVLEELRPKFREVH